MALLAVLDVPPPVPDDVDSAAFGATVWSANPGAKLVVCEGEEQIAFPEAPSNDIELILGDWSPIKSTHELCNSANEFSVASKFLGLYSAAQARDQELPVAERQGIPPIVPIVPNTNDVSRNPGDYPAGFLSGRSGVNQKEKHGNQKFPGARWYKGAVCSHHRSYKPECPRRCHAAVFIYLSQDDWKAGRTDRVYLRFVGSCVHARISVAQAGHLSTGTVQKLLQDHRAPTDGVMNPSELHMTLAASHTGANAVMGNLTGSFTTRTAATQAHHKALKIMQDRTNSEIPQKVLALATLWHGMDLAAGMSEAKRDVLGFVQTCCFAPRVLIVCYNLVVIKLAIALHAHAFCTLWVVDTTGKVVSTIRSADGARDVSLLHTRIVCHHPAHSRLAVIKRPDKVPS